MSRNPVTMLNTTFRNLYTYSYLFLSHASMSGIMASSCIAPTLQRHKGLSYCQMNSNLDCWIHGDWCQIVNSLQYKHGHNENLIGIKALQNMFIILLNLENLRYHCRINCFCNNYIASVASLIIGSTTPGLARSVFMTRSTVILFSIYCGYTKSTFLIYKTFFP